MIDSVQRIKTIVLSKAELELEKYINVDLKDIKVSSIQYIKIIVAIEQEFEMEFEDKCLLAGFFSTFDQLTEYVLSAEKISKNVYK